MQTPVTTAGARIENLHPQQRPLSSAVERQEAPSNLLGSLGPENRVRAGSQRCTCTSLSVGLKKPCKCDREKTLSGLYLSENPFE